MSRLTTSLVVFGLLCVTGAVQAGTIARHKFISFDVPGAASTRSVGINGQSVVAGLWYDTTTLAHGFVRSAEGAIETFDVPNATEGTYPAAVNAAGMVTGCYYNGHATRGYGFLRRPNGVIRKFNHPDAFDGTCATGINDAGAIVGYFAGTPCGVCGFERTPDGNFLTIEIPGGYFSQADGINDDGTIVGTYEDSASITHGFMRAADGTLTTFDIQKPRVRGLFAYAINSSGEVAGSYISGGRRQGTRDHAFLRDSAGSIIPFDLGSGADTRAFAINDQGVEAGLFVGTSGSGFHGFIRQPDGQVSTIDFPGSSSTQIEGINDDGVAAGAYDKDGATHGFLLRP